MPFWPICCESDAILFKKFRPGDRVGEFIWENFHPGYRDTWDIGRKNRDLGNRASPAPQMNTSMFWQRKESRGEISETEPAWLTGLIWRGPQSWEHETLNLRVVGSSATLGAFIFSLIWPLMPLDSCFISIKQKWSLIALEYTKQKKYFSNYWVPQ